ncbi:MAG: class C sortase [Oscillospiraceae bacterium]|nr:class C sortase [Oscillospiraceae bacterium]
MKRRKISALAVALLLVAGAGLLAYPTVSDLVNKHNGSYAISQMHAQLLSSDEKELLRQLQAAQTYNAGQAAQDYDKILDFGGGIMGAVRIPTLDLELPIYHGVSQEVLAKGIGHLPQSDLPVGGAGCHSVLTGHTGLVSARLFTDLEQLQLGDAFYIDILEQTLRYTVDQILVVLPSQEEALAAVPGEDYCTLVTCTPYGINSHRLLVRGKRAELPPQQENLPQATKTTWDLRWLWIVVAVIPAVPLLVWRFKRGI